MMLTMVAQLLIIMLMNMRAQIVTPTMVIPIGGYDDDGARAMIMMVMKRMMIMVMTTRIQTSTPTLPIMMMKMMKSKRLC